MNNNTTDNFPLVIVYGMSGDELSLSINGSQPMQLPISSTLDVLSDYIIFVTTDDISVLSKLYSINKDIIGVYTNKPVNSEVDKYIQFGILISDEFYNIDKTCDKLYAIMTMTNGIIGVDYPTFRDSFSGKYLNIYHETLYVNDDYSNLNLLKKLSNKHPSNIAVHIDTQETIDLPVIETLANILFDNICTDTNTDQGESNDDFDSIIANFKNKSDISISESTDIKSIYGSNPIETLANILFDNICTDTNTDQGESNDDFDSIIANFKNKSDISISESTDIKSIYGSNPVNIFSASNERYLSDNEVSIMLMIPV